MPGQLDQDMQPAAQWIKQYMHDVRNAGTKAQNIVLGLLRNDVPIVRQTLKLLPEKYSARNFTYLERHLKSLLWAYGGNRIRLDAPPALCKQLHAYYQNTPTGIFDAHLIGENIYGSTLQVESAKSDQIPAPQVTGQSIGRHLDGCRIGFDLGGSDRKCAALIQGEVVFSEEIPWDPYFQKDPQYHFDGIMDSLQRAANHLPRVDAIGGSAAGVYVDNEVRVASLFRGVAPDVFEKSVRHIFRRVQSACNNVPFVVINDGEVTALAGAMSLNATALLGISMGTSTAAGYVTPQGYLTNWLNELAFVPVDYRPDAPADEWSGDVGCAVQYFSQQGVARLAQQAGMIFEEDMPLAERLITVQDRMTRGDAVAAQIYQAIGNAFGHTLAYWSHFYTLEHVLVLGRVTSGTGGDRLLDQARACLQSQYPEIAAKIQLHTPDEKMKRHGQAVAAASLPAWHN
ncbi:MAG: ROK family protein [Kiritimatiellia bacterium]